jgi:hypothetical protein
LTPIAVLYVGGYLSRQIDEAKLRTEQISAASKMLDNLFADQPEPARVVLTINFMGHILGDEWKKQIASEMIDFYMRELMPKKTGEIMNIMPLDKRMAIQDIFEQLSQTKGLKKEPFWTTEYFIVAEATTNFANAIKRAKELKEKYTVGIYQSKFNRKYYDITIGKDDLFSILTLLEQAQRSKDARPDAYLTNGSTFKGINLLNHPQH